MLQSDVGVSVEAERGCGRRKSGGLYLVCDEGEGRGCGKFPFPLKKCPTCGGGFPFARGFKWIDPSELLEGVSCSQAFPCDVCPVADNAIKFQVGTRAGMVWVGEQYYEKPDDFIKEGKRMGISRRINKMPVGFEVGKHWVFLAHVSAVPDECMYCAGVGELSELTKDGGFTGDFEPWDGDDAHDHEPCENCDGSGNVMGPGIFFMFKPTRIEYVVTGDEGEEELDEMVLDGITPVNVQPDEVEK